LLIREISTVPGVRSKGTGELDDFDKELERRRLKFVRYADDFVIFVRSERRAVRVFASVQRYLTQHLKLVVNEQKSSVRSARGGEFLGFAFTGKRVTITAAPKKGFNSVEQFPDIREDNSSLTLCVPRHIKSLQASYQRDHGPQPWDLDGTPLD